MDLRSHRSGRPKAHSAKKPVSALFQSAWGADSGAAAQHQRQQHGSYGVTDSRSQSTRDSHDRQSEDASSHSPSSPQPFASAAASGGTDFRSSRTSRTGASPYRRAPNPQPARSMLRFWHLIPALRKEDRGLRRLCLSTLRFPLQFCRQWQSLTFVFVYFCIFLMLYDLHLKRQYNLMVESRLRHNRSLELLDPSITAAPSAIQLAAGAPAAPAAAAAAATAAAAVAAAADAAAKEVAASEAAAKAAAVAATQAPTGGAPAAPPPIKAGERVLVYTMPLDARFGPGCADALAALLATVHQDLSGGGLGPALDAHDDQHIHHTSPYALEVIFYHRLRQSRWHTDDVALAHAVYVPLFASLLASFPQCRDVQSAEQAEDAAVAQITASPTWLAWAGKRHFVVLGEPEGRYLSGAKCAGGAAADAASSLLCDKRLAPLTALVPELSPELDARRAVGRAPPLVVPMPSAVHLDAPLMEPIGFAPLLDASKRQVVVTYFHDTDVPAGPLGRALSEQMAEARAVQGGAVIIPVDMKVRAAVLPADWDLRVVELMRRSSFCMLQPRQPSLPSLFMNALTLGCLPVVFEKQRLPFAAAVRYEEFVVEMPAEDVVQKRVSPVGHLAQLMTNSGMMMKRREALRQAVGTLQYAQPEAGKDLASLGDVKDAFNRAMEELVATLAKQ